MSDSPPALRSDREVDLLFVYGTLVHGGPAEVMAALTRGTRKAGAATFVGRMFLVSHGDGSRDYPAVVPSSDPRDIVRGELLHLHAPSQTLPILDEYEGCAPSSPMPHEYRRDIASIHTSRGETVRAFIYLYVAEIDGLRVIEDGVFTPA